jgi:DNA-3-methyladenine glycosylase I
MTADLTAGRCPWVGSDPLMAAYHDEEWGVPQRDPRRLFELLLLEGFQAGLSWRTILHKRERYREALDGFDPERIAGYGEVKIAQLLADPGIVRNRLKVRGAVRNAQAWLQLAEREGDIATWLWGFVDGAPLLPERRLSLESIPATTPRSDAMSRALRREGFTFVGSTICYAFMQATGMVDDHVAGCRRYRGDYSPGWNL